MFEQGQQPKGDGAKPSAEESPKTPEGQQPPEDQTSGDKGAQPPAGEKPSTDTQGQTDRGSPSDDGLRIKLPDGFAYADDKNGIDFERLQADLSALGELRKADEDRRASTPDEADGYKLDLGDEPITYDNGNPQKLSESDPMWAQFREIAHKHGLSQEAASDFLRLHAEADRTAVNASYKAHLAEMADLAPGDVTDPHAAADAVEARLNALSTKLQQRFVKNGLGAKAAKALNSAAVVQIFEQLLSSEPAPGDPSPSSGGSGRPLRGEAAIAAHLEAQHKARKTS